MPLTAGKRNEENEGFSNTLQRLASMAFVPENFARIDTELAALELSFEKLSAIDGQELCAHLLSLDMDFANLEHFADFLAPVFAGLAKAVYQDIQQRSGAFSLGIFNKIKMLAV